MKEKQGAKEEAGKTRCDSSPKRSTTKKKQGAEQERCKVQIQGATCEIEVQRAILRCQESAKQIRSQV